MSCACGGRWFATEAGRSSLLRWGMGGPRFPVHLRSPPRGGGPFTPQRQSPRPAPGHTLPTQAAPISGKQKGGPETAASIPDFSGIWRHGSLPWFVPPASGPGPVTNRSRRQDNGVSNYGELVGDYTNPILQPWAAEVVKKKGELSLAGVTYPNPANQCCQEPVPFLFKHMAMQLLQRPEKVVMLFNEDHEVRYAPLNHPHPP